MNLSSLKGKRGIQVGAAVAIILALAVALAVINASPGDRGGVPDPLVAGDPDVAATSESSGEDSATAGARVIAATDGDSSSAADVEAGSSDSGGSTGGDTDADSDQSGDRGSTDGTAVTYKKVRIMWWNDTESKPLTSVTVSIGSATWSPDPTAESAVGAVSVPVDRAATLIIRPDGAGGRSIEVPILFQRMMVSESEQDAIVVEVSDKKVRVLGNPVENVDQSFDRF